MPLNRIHYSLSHSLESGLRSKQGLDQDEWKFANIAHTIGYNKRFSSFGHVNLAYNLGLTERYWRIL